jgi:chromosome segregation ATPase
MPERTAKEFVADIITQALVDKIEEQERLLSSAHDLLVEHESRIKTLENDVRELALQITSYGTNLGHRIEVLEKQSKPPKKIDQIYDRVQKTAAQMKARGEELPSMLCAGPAPAPALDLFTDLKAEYAKLELKELEIHQRAATEALSDAKAICDNQCVGRWKIRLNQPTDEFICDGTGPAHHRKELAKEQP